MWKASGGSQPSLPSSSGLTVKVFWAICENYGYSLKAIWVVYKLAMDWALNVIWNRGIVKKGLGLCHGIAGNVYIFSWCTSTLVKRNICTEPAKWLNWCRVIKYLRPLPLAMTLSNHVKEWPTSLAAWWRVWLGLFAIIVISYSLKSCFSWLQWRS